MITQMLMKPGVVDFGGVEFAFFRLRAGVTEQMLLEASARVDAEFLSQEEGLLGHVLLKGDDGQYADMALADTRERAETICHRWTGQAVALDYIELIDGDSVKMTFWHRMR